jgi:hypothetical protein
MNTVVRTAQLGVRFWDAAGGRAVADGLELRERRTGRRAIPNRSGVFVFHDLPPGPGAFEVRDRDQRFVDFGFTADTPHRGLFAPPCVAAASPPAAYGSIPLFSAPTRRTPPGQAVVRADLWDADMDAPAAGAVLEISGVNVAAPALGVADARGRVVVLGPYPEPHWQGASPPARSSSLSTQTWTVEAAVRYSPTSTSQPLDLCEALTQPAATLLASDSPFEVLPPQTLGFGRELVLRSTGRSVLLVVPH